jgi:hypothetical protein
MNVRKLMEADVIAHNRNLRPVVAQMPILILLRNTHPMYRADYTYKLLREGQITRQEAKEFVKLV